MKTKRLFAFLLALVMSLGLVLPAFAEGIEPDPAEIGETAEQAFGDAATLESVNNDPEPHRANLEDGYYLIGLNGWTVDGINAKDKLTQNPGNASEYLIKTTVAVGQEFKVAHIVDGQIGDNGWMYGAGDGNGNYRITSDTPSGAVTIYFRNTWNNDWNGYVYVGQNYVLTINASDNGSVSANIDTANVSTAETVILTVAPAAGYLLDSLTVDGADVTASVADGKYSFEMPGHNVTVLAQFAKIPYPTAKVVEMTPAKDVPLYDIATQKQIGTVDELEAEYSFTPDDPTPEQIAYYGPWHADYRISFDQDIAKDTFGLYGKYFGYGKNLEAAFQFPKDLKAGEEVYLLGSIGFDGAVTYNDCLYNIQEFLCGVYNLSEDNWGKTISVDLVIWDGSDPATRTVVSTTDYTFKGKAKLNITEAPELPQANVTAIETETVQINSENVALEAEYKFTPVEPTAIQLAYYGGWRADYRVSMNADTAAESFGLYGAYNGYGQEFKQGFLFPVPLTANEPIQLLTSAGLSSVTYDDVVNNIGEFICGVFNKSADNVGKTFKVELIIWDENDANAEPAVLATTTYTFVNQIPPLPKASIEEITENKDTNIPVYNPSTFAETGEVVEELGAEYKFTPDPETTEAQKKYYKDWRCDYRISFNKDIVAESFGLFGAYGEYNVAFLYPEDVNDSTVRYLLRDFGLDAKLTYKEVLNNVQQFKCGAFNLSDDNLNQGKWMKVELVMFAPDQTAEDSVVIATDYYYFGDKTNLVPPLPKASIEEITENKDTNIPVYNPSTFAETGEVVEELGAEYKFTPDPETTEAQKKYYKDWRCDYRISFNKDIVAESFGLFGAYGEYNVAFLYPEDVNESTVKYLLRDFGLDAKLTYKEVLNNVQQFKCGAFNLSDDNLNKDKWMKVELVMFAPDQTAEDSVVIATDYYYFGDKTNLVGPVPELPKADVEKITAETVKINGEDVKLEAEYQFTPVQPTEAQLNYYGNWYADYRVSMDANTAAESFGLFGKYSGYGTNYAEGFLFPQALTANEPVMLLELANLSGVTYNDMVKNIGEFICGVFNKSDENLGKTFKVELVIWNPAEPETKYVISTTKYTFEKPELPKADVEKITAETVKINGEDVKLEAEYQFTPVQPTEAQLAYYGNWYADYRVSMDANTTKETFGLYGEYDGYGTHFAEGFLFPQALTANEPVMLLELANLSGVTYNDMVKNIGEFICGVFNKSDENLGKTFKVELVIWNPAEPETKYVISTTKYTFEKPELPKANVEKITAETVKINGEDVKLEAEYQFTPVKPTEAQLNYYGNWYADYRVSMDAATTKETFGLYGEYDGYDQHFAQGFLFPQDLAKDETVQLLEMLDLTGVTYNDVVNNIGKFTCGVFNKSDENLGKTFTVELVIWNPADPDTKYVIATTPYTFEKPELPEANVKSITPATVEIDGESAVLEAEYEFTPVEPTEAQLAYYGNWYADYRVSMDANTTKETFGLYGEYDGYGQHFAQGFLFPQDLTKDVPVMLLALAGVEGNVTYNDIVNNIGKFTCGVFNKSDENLGKTFKVELVIWNPADPDTKYVIATTTYTFRKMYTLTLTSQDTDGNTNIAMLTGGGQFESGTEVTVTAPNDVAGFTFDGWYKDSYDPENKVAGTYAYTFTIEADTALVAVYKNNLSMGLLHVKGSTYKVNDGELQTSNNDFDIPIGDKVTLVYTGEDFLYWVNISDNIVSTSPTYNFTMVDETTLRLITSRNMEQNASAYAVFLNAYSQVQSEGRVTDAQGAEELFPKNNPSKIGVTFEKWVFEGTDEEATPDSIAARIAVPAPVVKIVPKYKAPEETYTLTVKYRNNGTEGDVEGYTELAIVSGKTKTITLSTIIDKVGGLDAESFSYWTLDGTTPVSFDKTGYMVVATKGKTITLTAVFGEEKEPEPIVRIEQMTATMNGEKYRVSTMMRYEVPEGYIVHESGFVRSTSGEFTDETLVIGAENTKKHISNFTVQSAVYVLNINFTDPGKVVYYKAYIIYEKDGQLFTQYSAMESGSYNQLTD